MKKLLTSLLVLSMFSGINAITLNADSNPSILVGQAKTLEEKADVALDNINLNTDLNNVVTNLLVPLEGLYESSIVWSSSDEDIAYVEENNTMIKITRPSYGENAVEVTLTATLTIYESKTSNITKKKDIPAIIRDFFFVLLSANLGLPTLGFTSSKSKSSINSFFIY